MKPLLLIYTSEFPFGMSETFLETEIIYLAANFNCTIITSNIHDGNIRKIPYGCRVLSIDTSIKIKDKILAMRGVFNNLFWKELIVIEKTYNKKITLAIIKTMLVTLHVAKKIKNQSKELLKGNVENNPVCLYSYWCDDRALAITLLKKETPNLVVFSRMHGWDVYFEASKISYLPFKHFITQELNALFSISQRGINYCKERWIVSDKNIMLSRLGVKAQRFLISNDDKRFLIVSCSSIIKLKRINLIIEALALITDLKITWLHFGDGPELKSLKKMSETILPSNITWEFKGWVSNSGLLDFYKTHSPKLFINVSSTEGIPVSIMEAMSFGIPVIATDVGGSGEIVSNENGFLINANPTPMEITGCIKTLINLPMELERKKKQAYETWQLNYNADTNYKQWVEQIKNLILQ